MSTLFILNDRPYGSERSYNGLRLAYALAKSGDRVSIFLIGDAAPCAVRGQKVPSGYYNMEVMLHNVVRQNGIVGVCGSCMDARGMTDEHLVEGTHRSSMDELRDWSKLADKVLVF